LKRILGLGLRLIGSAEGVGARHEIEILWGRVVVVLREIYGKDRSGYVESINRYIRELHDLDPSGQEFRYDRKRDDERSLDGVASLNLTNVVEILEEVADCLDSIASDFGNKFEILCQMERDSQNY
jgi:hypothetical protein